MIIDVHVHLPYHKIFPQKFLDHIARSFDSDPVKQPVIQKLIRANLNDHSGEQLVRLMDGANIDQAILLIADFGYSMGEAELSIAEIYQQHHQVMLGAPERFKVFGGIDPRRGRAGTDLFEHSIVNLGFRGLKLYPPCGFEMDDNALYPLYEICEKYNLPVLSHTGPSLTIMRTERRYPESIIKISQDFPGVNFILGHGGARAWRANVALAHKRPNIFLEISTFQTNAADPLELEKRFRYFFDHIPDQIMFGTDWPMFALGSGLKPITNLILNLNTISDEEKAKLFYKNAKLLNL